MELIDDIFIELKKNGIADIPVVIGGIIPEDDAEHLLENGLKAVFTPKDMDMNSIMDAMVTIIRETHGLDLSA